MNVEAKSNTIYRSSAPKERLIIKTKGEIKEERTRRRLEKNLENFKLLTNKGMWIYTLNAFSEINREQVETIAEVIQKSKKEEKRIPLSSIFEQTNRILEENEKPLLPGSQWKKDKFFNFVAPDYNLPAKGLKELYEEVKKESKEKYPALKVADILGGKMAPVIKDIYALEGRGDVGIDTEFSENQGYKETYYITGSGMGTARIMELYFEFNIKPYAKFMDKKNLIILSKADSNELIQKVS